MTRKLDEGTVSQIERALTERFGDPIAVGIAPKPIVPTLCEGCGCMQQLDEEETCSECGMMAPELDEKAPPGREKQVKALKKDPDVDNPFAVAWASYNKSH